MINLVAIIMPWLEFIGGVFLLTGLFLPGSALIIGGLLFVFLLAIGSALTRGLDISCGCFHTAEGEKIGFNLLLRNFILLGMVVYVMALKGGKISLDCLYERYKDIETTLKHAQSLGLGTADLKGER